MIIPPITQATPAQRNAQRQKNLVDYIRRLEQRYSESERRESVALLEDLLAGRIKEAEENGFPAK